MANPSLSRQFTLTNFTWKLRANGHLKGEKIGAVNYLKLSRIPTDIRIYWNSTNNRNTAFAIDELVRGFRINEKDEAGNAKTLENVWLWSEGEIPQEPLSDVIEIEYNGAGDLIEPLLGNKSGAIDKIEKVQVVSAIDKILQPIRVVQMNNTGDYSIEQFYRFNANFSTPLIKYYNISLKDYIVTSSYLISNIVYTNTKIKTGGNYSGVLKNGEELDINKRMVFQATNADYTKGELVLNDDYILGFLLELQNSDVTASVITSSMPTEKGEYKTRIRTKHSNTKITYTGVYTCLTKLQQDNPYGGVRGWDINPPIFESAKNIKPLSPIITESIPNSASSTLKINCDNFANFLFESTTDLGLSNFIFKTKNKLIFLLPAQNTPIFLSIIEKNNINESADFSIKLIEVSKTSKEKCFLYFGGISGLKIPIDNGFALDFNNKKSGMDYSVIEIPAGDIYKIELELLNVYEDSNE